jgi:WD40 repeat protein/class 3 adenylate cyclase
MNAELTPPLPFRDLPEGTVTFLFSDIEGSTQLLYRLGDQFAKVLAEHHRILREVIARGGGQIVRTEGDAFVVAFPRARNAASVAVEAQCALAQYPWPEGATIRVRMGLHTGEPEVALDDYVGITVHRAARIAHVGHGGQVLLSEATASLTGDVLPVGVRLLDLGHHLLKDIRRPEHIFQLEIEGLTAEFPPLRTLGTLPPEGARLPRPVGTCPYRGLSAFREADAPFYCGREAFVDLLEQAVRRQPLTAVIVGSSGSGKSSALFAGLLPRLRNEGGWQFALLRPGAQPFYALAGVLLPLLEGILSETDRLTETRKLAERLAKGKVSLAQVVERIHEKAPEPRQILLVVDQFEELYTLCSDAKTQHAFIDELLATAEVNKGRRPTLCVILMTMRADFMGQALAYRPFADSLQVGSVLMGPMTREELRAAIEKPAEMQGAAFEVGLVERILEDVGDKPGNLPLLEFTLTLLWERQTDGWLTHKHYEAMGSVEGALATYADQVYAELDVEEQKRIRQALVQLVRPGEGTEDTRRVAMREELGDENWKLIQHLADRRLVVTGRDDAGHETAEVVHEALIQRWGRFREWMNADRAFRAWQERLRGNLRQWQDSGQDDGALLAGTPLSVAQNWLLERAADLSSAEVGYIEGSGLLQEQRHKEQERRRQRTILALVTGLVVVAVLGVIAIVASQRASLSAVSAQEQARLASSRELAAAAVNNLNVDPELSVLLALEALEQAYTREAENALHASLPALHLLNTAILGEAIETITLSPDGKILAAGEGLHGANILLLDSDTGQVFREITTQQRVIFGLAFSPDGRRLASADWDGDAKVWDVASGERLLAFHAHEGGASRIVFSPDGTHLVTCGDDAMAKIWDSSTGALLLTLAGHAPAQRTGSLHPGGVIEVAYTPDGRRLATGGADGTAMIWDASTGQVLQALAGHTSEIYIGFNPDGTRLATAGADGLIKIWDTSPGSQSDQPLVLINHEQQARSLAFSPDGTHIAVASQDGAIRVWDANTGIRQLLLVGHVGNVDDLVFSTDGLRLYSGSADGTVKTWELTPGKEVFTFPGEAPFYSPDGMKLAHAYKGMVRVRDSLDGEVIADLPISETPFIIFASFSPDEKLIVTANWAGTAHVWDSATGEQIWTLSGHTGRIFKCIFSPDGTRIVTASDDKTARVWDVGSGKELLLLGGHTDALNGAAYSPDGRFIATASWDNTIRLWDAATGAEVLIIKGETELNDVAYSPDGRRLAASSNEGTVFVWDISEGNGNILYRLVGHTAAVVRLDFSSDSKYLATPSFDGSLKVWRMDTGEEGLTFKAGIASLTQLAFSPDGQHLATGGFEGLVRVYNLDLQSTIDLAISRVTRGLTEAECQRYLHLEQCPHDRAEQP